VLVSIAGVYAEAFFTAFEPVISVARLPHSSALVRLRRFAAVVATCGCVAAFVLRGQSRP